MNVEETGNSVSSFSQLSDYQFSIPINKGVGRYCIPDSSSFTHLFQTCRFHADITVNYYNYYNFTSDFTSKCMHQYNDFMLRESGGSYTRDCGLGLGCRCMECPAIDHVLPIIIK